MQLGFVIDHSRCIGCHACTVACKSENDVPLGSFRTWVKYTESGHFPEVKRSFAVLRCNQCSDAPCVTICPVTAIDKRPDGIVDVDPDVCIGCKACMQGCPYDALYLNEDTGTVQKCHFCAHRVEQGLAPACAVVCPTEAIVPGDFDDPNSVVSGMKASGDLAARKTEAGTHPNVFYKEAAPAGLDPLRTNGAGGYLWAQAASGVQMDAQAWLDMEAKAVGGEPEARTTYDVSHPPLWAGKITGYLFAKSLAAGLWLAAAPLLRPGSQPTPQFAILVPALALMFLAITSVLLVADLKKPSRFLYILLRPNWNSWLARGSFVLMGYGGLLTVYLVFGVMGTLPGGAPGWALHVTTSVLAGLSAAYTGWLFAQAKGRVLWMKRGTWLHLLVQAVVAGAALLSMVGYANGWDPDATDLIGHILFFSLAAHLLFMLAESKLAPAHRGAEYTRVHALLSKGPFALRHWGMGTFVGVLLPVALLLAGSGWIWALAGALALAGLFVEEDVTVRAGQALPIS